MSKKWLITGGSGFLGGRLLKDLSVLFPNDSFTGTARRDSRREEFEKLNISFVQGNLEDINFVEKITEGMDIIVHCAALSSPWGIYDDFYNANIKATKNLVDSASKNSVSKFINIATPGVYHTGGDVINAREDFVPTKKLINLYASTKHEAEKYIISQHSTKLNTISIRPRALLGAEDTVIFPRMIRAYLNNSLAIIGDGNNIVNFCSVKNVAALIFNAINADSNHWGEIYNITDDQTTNQWDMLNNLLKQLGYTPLKRKVPFKIAYFVAYLMELYSKYFNNMKEPLLTRYSIVVAAKNFTLDISKAKNKLGYKPVITSEESLEEFVNWYKKNHKPI